MRFDVDLDLRRIEDVGKVCGLIDVGYFCGLIHCGEKHVEDEV